MGRTITIAIFIISLSICAKVVTDTGISSVMAATETRNVAMAEIMAN